MSDRGAFSVEEVADWIGVSKRHVYELMDAGEIPYVKLGARRLVSKHALERILDPTVVDLNGVDVDDVGRLIAALRHVIPTTQSDSERAALERLHLRLAERVAHAQALAAPVRELAS